MKQHPIDAIEKYAIGESLFPDVVTEKVIGKVEHDPSHLSDNKANSKTLADLISEHIPTHLQADVLARIFENQIATTEKEGEQSSLHNNQSNELG